MCERRAGWVECWVEQGTGEVVQGQVTVNVWVQVKGRVCGGSLCVCEELVSNNRGRHSMKPTGGQTCGGAQGGGAGVLVAHMALAGMLDLFYLKV